MEIIRKNSIAFLRSCAPVSTRIMIKDRKEDFAIVRQDNQHIRLHSCKLDLGNAAVTFLYDSNFEIITSFLLESCEIVAQIKQRENNTEQWSYFNNLLLNLCYGGMMRACGA